MNEQPQTQTIDLTFLLNLLGDYELKKAKDLIKVTNYDRRNVEFEITEFSNTGEKLAPYRQTLNQSHIDTLRFHLENSINQKKLNIANEQRQIEFFEQAKNELLTPLLADISHFTEKADKERINELEKANKKIKQSELG